MGTMESLLEMIFGRKQKEEEPTLREAQDIVEGEISREEKALCEFASKKFAEIRYLISSLSKNSEELEKHEIKVDEGNKTYRQIVSTSQKNLARHLRGISNKLMPPQKINAESIRAYVPAAIKAVSTDLMPYWKNIAIARLMLRDEVKTIGENLQELSVVLNELHSSAFSKKMQDLRLLVSTYEEIGKIERDMRTIEGKGEELNKTILRREEELVGLERRLSSKEFSPETVQLKKLELERTELEEKKAQIVSKFNSEIAPLEKVLKRMLQISQSGESLSQKEKELLPMLLSSPSSAFVSDPNGFGCKGIFQKAQEFIEQGKIPLKEGESEKKIAALKSFLEKDFFTEYFWQTNQLQANLLRVQKGISSLGVSGEIRSLKIEIDSAKSAIAKSRNELSASSVDVTALKLKSKRADYANEFNSVFVGKYKVKI